MKKQVLLAAGFMVATASLSASANTFENVGIGINYGLFSGPTFELSYPLGQYVQLRGAFSSGMSTNTKVSQTDINYKVHSDGGIHRLAFDYHPFDNGLFFSAGYAMNAFQLNIDGSTTQAVTVGGVYFATADAKLKGELDWNDGATLSFGWGHAPSSGWGGLVEVGAIFTGSANVSLKGTGTLDGLDVSNEPIVLDALRAEEKKIKDDVADFEFLPILQAGVTYRF